ncbi:MAG: hypothetical protein V4643_10690 [Bacteroidota bacterium]
MTTFSDNELIDKVLKASYESPRQYIEVLYALEKITGIKDTSGPSEVYNLTKKISKKIISEGIADCKDDREIAIMINQKGIDIVDNGGYLEYMERLKNQALYDAKIQQATDDKLFTDLTIAKWQKKTFWYLFIGSILSLLLSIYSTLQSSSTQQQLEKTEKIIDSMQKTVIHLDQELLKVVSDTTKRFQKSK